MRARDIEIGCTYLVFVPYRLPTSRYPYRDQPGTPEWSWWWMTGCRFRLTVTAVDAAGDPPMVEGLRVTESSWAELELSDEQAAALGLPYGRYRVRGQIVDDRDWPVALPELRTLRIPARWLRPTGGPPPRTHIDLDTLGPWGF
ncbi:hypothetical protein IU459_32895 [Nocardia amamiensis]|uniref:Uncharacterized protein n=1 Tax=Nocardia amamiensis TaxID=404578 RepID=A0ABS0D0F0_9NOCA|nr:hypothetical protein [Nocardia amamiensis]MBF6302304.1 hypothetical protein [Nocardia amamiensis]